MANGTDGELIIARDVDDEPASGNQRSLTGFSHHFVFWYCVVYTAWHLLVLNVFPLETWAFRTLHVAGGLGIGFLVALLMRR